MPPPIPISNADRARHAIGLIEQGNLKAAERLLKDVLKADPGQFDALLGLGVLCGMRGQDADAVKHLTRAARRNPRSDAAHYNLGQALIRLGRHAEAIEALKAAAALAERGQIHEKLGDCMRQLGRLDEAAIHFVRAVDLEPANSLALSSAVETLRRLCDWSRLAELQQRLLAACAADRAVEPLLMLHVTDDPNLQRKAAQAYWRTLVAPSAPPSPRIARRDGAKIRVGYLSADFRQHPMVSVIAEAIELHDRARFEVTGLSYGQDDGSPQRRRMERAFDRFVDMHGTSDQRMAARIGECGIDILVDLSGYTANARLGVVAARPAPIVCHYMGYPGTLGSPAYDYLIADRIVAPAGCDGDFSEALVRLPVCYWANDRKRAPAATTTRAEHGLPEDAIVLCSFNGQQKLSPVLLDIWARVLAAVPQSVLWLYADHSTAADNLRREAAARGITHDRLVIAGRLPPEQHLARIALADLMLDAMPYGGHTTACDALWMGVPVLTVAGRAFAARVGASLLTHASLPHLITPDPQAYEREATALATDRPRLAALKASISGARGAGGLFDTAAFTRALEAAYSEMWRRHRSALPPAPLAP